MDGYKIIDLKGIEITANGVTIPGIYKEVAESNKPLVIANLNLSGMIFRPFNAGFIAMGSDDDVLAFSLISEQANGFIEFAPDDTVLMLIG